MSASGHACIRFFLRGAPCPGMLACFYPHAERNPEEKEASRDSLYLVIMVLVPAHEKVSG
eukprot:1001569-Pelagomonas_calceolata.AAC.3